jgi:hypothetical protein
MPNVNSVLKRFFLVPLVFVTFAGCKNFSTDSISEIQQIMPLAVGNEWIYGDKNFDSIGHITFLYNDTLKIRSVVNDHGQILYYDQLGFFGSHAFILKANGLWSFVTGELSPNLELFEIPYPIKKDTLIVLDTTLKQGIVDSNGNYTSDEVIETIILKNENVLINVPAGSFFCYQYQIDQTVISTKNVVGRHDVYYALNLGKVYEEYFYSNPLIPLRRSYIRSLKSYHLN